MATKPKLKKADLDALYAAEPDEFVAERDELAKRLRGEGSADEAKAIKALRKPSLPAWAINQAARRDRAAAKRLVKAGKGLAAAQEKAMGGAGSEKLRDAMAAESEAVEEMMAAVAEATKDGPKLNSGMQDRARDTMRAIAGDEELRAEFEAAQVTRDRQPVGFGGISSPAPTSGERGAKGKRGSQTKRKPSAKKLREAEARVRRAQRDAKAAAKRVTQAEKSLKRAQESLATAEEKLSEAEQDKAASDSELDDAKAALADVR